jgi:hypothetical protein
MKGNVCQNKYFLCRTLANLHLRKEKKNKQCQKKSTRVTLMLNLAKYLNKRSEKMRKWRILSEGQKPFLPVSKLLVFIL